MKIIVAENSGFCFGVAKAINETTEELNKSKDVLYSLGPLIHNKQEIQRLNSIGVNVIDSIEEGKSNKVIVRSHGVPLEIYKKAKANNIDLIDATCPFVRKIQKKVKEYCNKGYQVVIIGNPKHPEIIGIKGWCSNKAIVVSNESDVEEMQNYDKICIVAQTTLTKEKFNRLSKLILAKGNTVEIFNTICNATKLRQQSCEEVAKVSDAMVVIGGYHSSNTQKLVEISKKYCDNTYHIETADELPLKEIQNFETVGITAGASTPEWIIKEVIRKMSENNKMNEMMEAIEKSMVTISKGDIVKGSVILVTNQEVMVNIGYKSDGIIKRNELSNDPDVNPKEVLKTGDEIEVYVLKLDDGEGNVVLSKKRVDNIKNWEDLELVFNEKKIVTTKVIEVVKGGVITLVNGLRGFIPASHISVDYVDDLSKYIGKNLDVQIIEFDQNKKRIVLSRKLVEKKEVEEKRKEIWNSLEKGKEIEGEVKRLADFGAFVDIGGLDGLIHVSDLSWGRVKHPSEVVKEGDKVKVIVLDFDMSKGKVSLGLKQTISHPWEDINTKYNVGDVVEGKVVNLVDFGAFVELEEGLDGLVHISQISDDHIAKPSEKLNLGQIVPVKILDINTDEKRLSLSIKEATQKKDSQLEEFNDDSQMTIGDIVKKN